MKAGDRLTAAPLSRKLLLRKLSFSSTETATSWNSDVAASTKSSWPPSGPATCGKVDAVWVQRVELSNPNCICPMANSRRQSRAFRGSDVIAGVLTALNKDVVALLSPLRHKLAQVLLKLLQALLPVFAHDTCRRHIDANQCQCLTNLVQRKLMS